MNQVVPLYHALLKEFLIIRSREVKHWPINHKQKFMVGSLLRSLLVYVAFMHVFGTCWDIMPPVSVELARLAGSNVYILL